MPTFVVIGGGHAAGQAVASLRQEGFEGEIVVIGDEPFLPYQRPPLSKQYLSGEQGLDRVYLRPEKFYEERNITLKLGVRVESLDCGAHTVVTSTGETISYDKALLCTGSRPRQLNAPGIDLEGIHYLRGIADVDGIRAEMADAKTMIIVGGGYIGLEVAAVTRTAGLEVSVLEMESRILNRVTTPTMSEFYTQLHEGRGVKILTDTAVSGFEGDGRVSAAVTATGEKLPADIVIVGIGILPNIELAEAAGLDCDNGIVVDERCATSNPDVYAAGDCTNHPNPLLNRRLRLESVPNAMEQARVAAANLLGGDKSYAAIPWFWSDQYELKLQMVGFSTNADQEVLRGDPSSNQFARFYLENGVLVAADAVNSPKEFMACRQLVAKQAKVDVDKLADSEVPIKELLG
jgi:3-phenylpropionate/trans-cinnamate dioxygenase ferredoxin reductase subunit